MFNLGVGEITIILILAMIFIGPKKLPELASGLGKIIREIRKTTADVKNEITLDDEIRRPFEELREAVTLAPEELKRRDNLRKELENLRKQAEEAEAAIGEIAASAGVIEGELAAGAVVPQDGSATTDPGLGSPAPSGEPQDAVSAGGAPGAGGTALAGSDAAAGEATPTAAPSITSVPAGAASGPIAPTAPPPGTVAAGGGGIPRPTASRSDLPRRTLRGVPEPKPPEPASLRPPSAADAANTTQILSEADLVAATVRSSAPPPPPAAPAAPAGTRPRTAAAPPPPPPSSTSPRLPGATPPKKV